MASLRLDADTTGAVVLCKTRQIAALLHDQFVAGKVAKQYLARVHGKPGSANFECHEPIADSPGPDGVRLLDEQGAPASTRFEVLHAFDDGTTLLNVQPLSGRTNQIRVHLWSLGLPIVGDPIYFPGNQVAPARTRDLDAPPLCLHASSIELTHPLTRQTTSYNAPAPEWARHIKTV